MILQKFKVLHRDLYALILLTIVQIPTLLAFIPKGSFYTHDGGFHLVRLVHYYQQLQTGIFPVRLIPEMAYGYGYPTFNFFYPFPYLLASIFHFVGFNFGDSLKLLFVTISITSVFATYLWLKQHFGLLPSLIGALLYLYVPFRFVTLYVTGQIGGFFALLWMPLILWCLYQIVIKNQWLAHLALILVTASMVLSHLISVIAFLPLVIAYVSVLLFQKYSTWKQRWTTVRLLLVDGVLGMGLSAFYLIPAVMEQNVIKAGSHLIVEYQDHWPTFKQLLYSSWGYGSSVTGSNDTMSFQVGLAQWVVIAVSFILIGYFLWTQHRKSWKTNQLVAGVCLLMVLLTLFLMLPLSHFWWEYVPLWSSIQYPWRLLAIMMMLTSYLAAWLSSRKWGLLLLIPVIGLSLINNRNYLRTFEPKRFMDNDYVQNKELFLGSTDISWELAPIQMIHHPVASASSLVQQPMASVSAIPSSTHVFSLTVSKPQIVILNLFYFPSWQVTVNGQTSTTQSSPTGLLSFQIPAGESRIVVTLGSSPIQKLGNLLSLLAIPAIIIFGWWLRFQSHRSRSR